MNITKPTLLLSSLLLTASILLSCDDFEKLQLALQEDLMNKLNAEIDQYPELSGVNVKTIDPVSEDSIVKNGDIYTANTKATLSYVMMSEGNRLLPKVIQMEKTIDITVSGTKEDVLSGNYTWDVVNPLDSSLLELHHSNVCSFLLDTKSESKLVCHNIDRVLESNNKSDTYNKCTSQYDAIYGISCKDYLQKTSHESFDDSKYWFYETCFLLKSNNDYNGLVDQFIEKGLLNDADHYLHSLDLKNPQIRPQVSSGNCQTLCGQIIDPNAHYQVSQPSEQCISTCQAYCDGFCGKIYKNYEGADDALLTIFLYTNYLNSKDTHFIEPLTKRILKDYGDKVAIFFGNNPDKLHKLNYRLNRLEEVAYLIERSPDLHRFFMVHADELYTVSLTNPDTYQYDLPKHKQLLAKYHDYDFNNDLSIFIKPFDPYNHIDLQSVANEMNIQGKGSLFLLNDKIIPVDTSVNEDIFYDSLKSVIDKEIDHARRVSEQTGLKGLPLANYIRSKAYQPKKITNNTVEVLNAPTTTTDTKGVFIETGKSPVLGNNDAPVTIVVFSDFQCHPFCNKWHDSLKKLLNTYPQDVRIVFKHYPLRFHNNAMDAAKASVAAQNQNGFWTYAEKLFTLTDVTNSSSGYNGYNSFREAAIETAREQKLNVDKFIADMDSPETTARINADIDLVEQFKISGTPNSFVNGQRITGAQSYEKLEALFLDERETALKMQKALALNQKGKLKGEALYKAIVNGTAVEPPKKIIDTSKDIHIGDPNAPITVVIFFASDFIRTITSIVPAKTYLSTTGNTFHFIFKPIENKVSVDNLYGRALLAADKQNFFLEMSDFLELAIFHNSYYDYIPKIPYFESKDERLEVRLERIIDFVRSTGYDVDQFLRDLNSEETKKQIQKNSDDYMLLNCKSDSTCMLINGTVVDKEDFNRVLKANYEKFIGNIDEWVTFEISK